MQNMMPDQTVPYSQRDSNWLHENMKYFSGLMINDSRQKRKDIECWMFYHNQWDEREFDYLTKIEGGTNGENDYYLPARVRNIPIQRSKLDTLISQQRHRPFVFSVFSSDENSVKEKYQEELNSFMKRQKQVVKQVQNVYKSQLISIQQQEEQINSSLMAQPKDENEMMQQQQLKLQLPHIQLQLDNVKEMITSEIMTKEKDFQKARMYSQYTPQDWKEEIAQKMARLLRSKLGIPEKSRQNFISQVVTGKQAYFVDWEPGSKLPIFKSLNMNNVYFPASESIDWIQDGDWCGFEERLPVRYVCTKYNLNKEEREQLERENYSNHATSDFVYEKTDSWLQESPYSGSATNEIGVSVKTVFWRSQRKINIKRSPNPYEEGKYFTHFIDDDAKVYNHGQMYWDRKIKKWVDKETLLEYDKKDVINANKGEELKERWIDVIYSGKCINGNIFKDVRERTVRVHSVDDYQSTPLPIIGPSFNNITKRPYSLIWATKDIQKLYNLFNFHRELLLATSGVKGTIMDVSQKPEGMSDQEWIYYKKLGTAWIETFKKTGRVNTSFNQFGSYDDSVSPSIQYIDNILMSLENMLGLIIGVPHQREGQVVSTDQVGTYQMAIQQANLVTEIIYAEHDEVERRAFQYALNYALKYGYKDGGTFNLNSEDLGMGGNYFKVPSNILNNIDWDIIILNNTREETELKELKRFAVGNFEKGMLNFPDLIRLYSTKTLKEIEKKSLYFIEEAEKKAMDAAREEREFSKQEAQELEQIKGQVEAQIKEQENQLKSFSLKLDETLGIMTQQREDRKQSHEENKWEDEKRLKALDIASEREVEGAYLGEQQRSNKVNERLKAIELEMNAIMQKVGLRNDKEKNDNDKQKNKIASLGSSAKGKTGNKEHIKDN